MLHKRFLWWFALVLLPNTVLAAPPYPVHGLHTQMSFTDAFSRATELGGHCQDIRPNRKRGGVSASCSFTQCADSQHPARATQKTVAPCNQQNHEAATLAIAGQPVSTIEFEAPNTEKPVNSISILFSGEQADVREALLDVFGAPNIDTESAREESWSDSRRLFWTTGKERAALLDSPQMIFLAADRKPAQKK